jgi:hypothetical protein
MAKKLYRPGQKAPVSGQYRMLGPKGSDTGQDRSSTVRGHGAALERAASA